MTTKLITAAALVLTSLLPTAALAYYPYTYFTGTQYYTGPGYFMGGGGFSTGPTDMTVSQPYGDYNNYSNSYSPYGPSTISYNPMTGQGNFGCNYGSCGGGYGYGQSYSNSYSQSYQQYVPQNVQQYLSGYNYNMSGANMGGYGGYGY
jgi:hypothetical protein